MKIQITKKRKGREMTCYRRQALNKGHVITRYIPSSSFRHVALKLL